MKADQIDPVRSALYYPSPFILDDNWLKTAALFWDHIYRIVPYKFSEMYVGEYTPISSHSSSIWSRSRLAQTPKSAIREPSNTAQAFIEDLAFIRDFTISNSNRHERLSATCRLCELMEKFPAYFNEHMTCMSYFSWGEMEHLKIILAFGNLLFENGALVYDEDTRLLFFEKFAGSVYMALLAKYIGGVHNLPIVTDDLEHHVLLNCDLLSAGPPEYKLTDDGSQGFTLCNLALNTIGIGNLSDVSAKRIIRFRQRYDSERVAFVSELDRLAKNLPKAQIQNEQQFQWYLQDQCRALETSMKDFEKALRGDGIETVFDLTKVSLSLPLAEFAAKHLAISEPLAMSISTGIGVGALIYRTRLRREKAAAGTPSAYYLHEVSKHLTRDQYFTAFKDGVRNLLTGTH